MRGSGGILMGIAIAPNLRPSSLTGKWKSKTTVYDTVLGNVTEKRI